MARGMTPVRRFVTGMLLGVIIGMIGAVLIGNSKAALYEASFMIAPKQQRALTLPVDLPFADSLLREFGAVSSDTYDRFLTVLTSRDIAAEIAESPALMRRLFPDQWDAAIGDWRPPPGFGNATRRFLSRLFGLPGWNRPSVDEVVGYLNWTVTVEPIRRGAFHVIHVRHPDPEIALLIAREILRRADEAIRAHDRSAARYDIQFLNTQLRNATIAELRSDLSRSLAVQLQRSMAISNPRPYSVEVFSRPALIEHPVFPQPQAMLMLGGAAGAGFGLVIAYVTILYGRGRRARRNCIRVPAFEQVG